jgi:hypothetical protein
VNLFPTPADRLRIEVEVRHKRMRRIVAAGYGCIALHVALGAWFASRIALGDADGMWIVVLNTALAALGLRWWPRRWSQWLEVRAGIEREIERLEHPTP